MLTTLPGEILDHVFAQLPTAELKSLSRVSRHIHIAVEPALWETVTIQPPDEFRLHRFAIPREDAPLRHTRHLRFYATFSRGDDADERCPHARRDPWGDPWSDDERDSSEDEDEDEETAKSDDGTGSDDDSEDELGSGEEARFESLARKAEMLIERLQDDQLRSFSWDLGTCVPSSILGPDGILSLKHPSITSLRLATDCGCIPTGRAPRKGDGESIDLTPFGHLTSICWRAPAIGDLDALAPAVWANAPHLQTLELDLVRWARYELDLLTDAVPAPNSIFADWVLGLPHGGPGPLFPVLRTLSLTEVSLTSGIAEEINFGMLTQLTLRKCKGVEIFLKQAAELGVRIGLETLEIQMRNEEEDEDNEPGGGITDFLDSFTGLRELFVGSRANPGTLNLWNHVARHKATLRRCVQHFRSSKWEGDGDPTGQSYFREYFDVPTMYLSEGDFAKLEADPSLNPLSKTALECIGLNSEPNLLKPILAPLESTKLIHIRCTRENKFAFADWAFGPEGLPSLEWIVCGDLGHDCRRGADRLLFRRSSGGVGYQVWDKDGSAWREVFDRYRNMLEACPAESLLKFRLPNEWD